MTCGIAGRQKQDMEVTAVVMSLQDWVERRFNSEATVAVFVNPCREIQWLHCDRIRWGGDMMQHRSNSGCCCEVLQGDNNAMWKQQWWSCHGRVG